MPKWIYVNDWENPKEKIKDLAKENGRITSSPVFFGYWVKVSPYRAVPKDFEEGIHSLIQENTCTCDLIINKSANLLAILESKHHRNHKTLEPQPNPKLRGLAGRKLSWPLMGTEQKHSVDVLWDGLVQLS